MPCLGSASMDIGDNLRNPPVNSLDGLTAPMLLDGPIRF